MKAIILAAGILLAISPAFARGHGGGYHSSGGHSSFRTPGVTRVRSYTKRDGTFVEHHDRTRENKTQRDNWSTKGNTNPETGKPGTVEATH